MMKVLWRSWQTHSRLVVKQAQLPGMVEASVLPYLLEVIIVAEVALLLKEIEGLLLGTVAIS